VRRDLNIRLLLMYHQSWFIFAEPGFTRSGPGLKCLVKSSTTQLLNHLTTQLLSPFVVAERPCVFVVFVFVSSWQFFVGYRLWIMGHEKQKMSFVSNSLLFTQTTNNGKQANTSHYIILGVCAFDILLVSFFSLLIFLLNI
jgi:hypothetical protein